MSAELGRALGQQVVIENRPGAGGTIGHAAVAQAAPDGHTLVLATNSTYAIAAHLYPSLPYRHARDLRPVSHLAASPLILAVRTTLDVDGVAALLARAKADPGGLNIASGGNGSTSHLAAELLMSLTGTRMMHVPYKGGGPANQALAAGAAAIVPVSVSVVSSTSCRTRSAAVGRCSVTFKNDPSIRGNFAYCLP